MKLLVTAGFLLLTLAASGQDNPAAPTGHGKAAVPPSAIPLHESGRKNLFSEMGGAFMGSAKCDSDGNLYIRKYAADRPLLGPVVKIDSDGKRAALFDPVTFSQVELVRADAFAPAPDGGLYQIAQSGVVKPRIYVLHFSPDGSSSSPIRLEADFEAYSFAPFLNGSLLVSGVERDVQNRSDRGHAVTEVFSADGRLLTQLVFNPPAQSAKTAGKPGTKTAKSPLTLDLSEAETGVDGSLYAMRNSSPALIYVISPAGEVVRTLKVSAPVAGAVPGTFHVSKNRLAVSFGKDGSWIAVVIDAQTGQKVGTYFDSSSLGTSFACYSADDGVFTFLNLGEGNEFEVIRAQAQ